MKKTLSIILVSFALLSVNACGIKPKSLEPKNDSSGQEFPRTYPTK